MLNNFSLTVKWRVYNDGQRSDDGFLCGSVMFFVSLCRGYSRISLLFMEGTRLRGDTDWSWRLHAYVSTNTCAPFLRRVGERVLRSQELVIIITDICVRAHDIVPLSLGFRLANAASSKNIPGTIVCKHLGAFYPIHSDAEHLGTAKIAGACGGNFCFSFPQDSPQIWWF